MDYCACLRRTNIAARRCDNYDSKLCCRCAHGSSVGGGNGSGAGHDWSPSTYGSTVSPSQWGTIQTAPASTPMPPQVATALKVVAGAFAVIVVMAIVASNSGDSPQAVEPPIAWFNIASEEMGPETWNLQEHAVVDEEPELGQIAYDSMWYEYPIWTDPDSGDEFAVGFISVVRQFAEPGQAIESMSDTTANPPANTKVRAETLRGTDNAYSLDYNNGAFRVLVFRIETRVWTMATAFGHAQFDMDWTLERAKLVLERMNESAP